MPRAAPTLVLLTLIAAGGCATVVAPKPPGDAVQVYLTNYGRHSSLLLPDPRGHLNEYAYGDFDWFAENKLSAASAVRAMLFSAGPTIGRRQLLVDADNEQAVAHATGAKKVSRIIVSRDDARGLIERIDGEYHAHLNSVTYNALAQMWFVRAGRHYSAFHNCNHAVAAWLRELGCSIKGPVMLSAFRVRQAQ